MTKKSKGHFSEKGKSILHSGPPKSIGDLLPDQDSERKAVDTEDRKHENTEGTKKPKTRHEMRISYDLSERLRNYVFENRTTKTAVVEKALMTFLDQEETR